MDTYIQNYGITQTYVNTNNQKYINQLKWKGKYDGEKADIDLQLLHNGNKENIKIRLNNDDILELLNIQPVEKSLEERLIHDFMPQQYNYYNVPFVSRKKKKNNITKRRRKINKNNKSKTTYRKKF
jgi:hypothetical protein